MILAGGGRGSCTRQFVPTVARPDGGPAGLLDVNLDAAATEKHPIPHDQGLCLGESELVIDYEVFEVLDALGVDDYVIVPAVPAVATAFRKGYSSSSAESVWNAMTQSQISAVSRS